MGKYRNILINLLTCTIITLEKNNGDVMFALSHGIMETRVVEGIIGRRVLSDFSVHF